MLVEKNKCSGCGTCYSSCPKNAITLMADSEGFLYPQIDDKLCINCGLCEKVCPVTKKFKTETEVLYAAVVTNEQRIKSSSGGVFNTLANNVLNKGGYVCGAAFDENNQVYHKIIDNIDDLDSIMRSKYVQSNLKNVFKEIKVLLDNDKEVLFVGTGCQTNGLKSFLRKDYDKLLTVDIICHGAPSPSVWNCYLYNINKVFEFKGKIENFNFRDKTNGWSNYGYSFTYNGLKVLTPFQKDNYSKVFLKDLSLRPSCYECVAKGDNRASDVTLGDFWGCDNFNLSIKHENKGLSLVIIHSNKAKMLFEGLDDITLEKVEKAALNGNPSYYKSCIKPKNRDLFMSEVNNDNFNELAEKYTITRVSIIRKIVRKAKRIIKKAF